MGNPKELRKQLRNVVQELLPDLLKSEIVTSLHKDISGPLHVKLDSAVREIQNILKQVEQRSKDAQGYLIRQTLQSTQAKEAEKNEQSEQEVKGS